MSSDLTRPQSLADRIRGDIAQLKEEGLWMSPRILDAPQHSRTRVGGRDVVNLASNNYLGFADHPFLKERAREYVSSWGAGAGAVRNIAGTFSIHIALERQIAEFKCTESVLVMTAGFTTNQGTLGALLREGDVVISDERNHASIIDGLRLTKAQRHTFRHKDITHLEELLGSTETSGIKLIVTDGVFSVDGDIAPLDQIVPVARRYGAIVYVDDAHGSGVLGEGGRGTVHHFGFAEAADIIQVGTLSKAWGVIGGYAAGPAGLSDLLINRARPYIFSTAQPPAVVGAISAAIELVQREPQIIERLWSNARYFKKELALLGFDTMGSETPITPVLFGDARIAFEASAMLFERGIFAVGMGFPIVAKGQARIRNMVTAEHTVDELDIALAAYREVGRALGVI
jgi:glycine C-acetyltransferase